MEVHQFGFHGDNEHEIVVFRWSNKHGHCYECGIPAAFRLVHPKYAQNDPAWLRCSVCAANAAADGETIERLFEID